MREWFDRDSFWEATEDKLFTPRHWENAPGQVENAIALLGVAPGAAVLDLCCGPGRHSLELARRGFNVTGVDRTAMYLNQAREQAQAEGLEVEFVQRDMRRFIRLNAFDAAINMYTSFGYFKDPADDKKVLVNLHRSLKPGGALLIDTMGKEVLARVFVEREWSEQDGAIMLEERKLHPGWDWIDCRWVFLKGSRRTEVRFGHRLYSAVELSSLLLEAGFADVKAFGDLQGAPYDHTARRLIVVARKGERP
jgi:SAM-dependent methyltransferase